ncbi:heat-shock protein [Longibacter salinarum]|uniref:Heat-shock protein n=1 Tax=Longibacter salinarum TaxID=1850348 RepID=A0A2A8D0I6_9BACT|nr:Hsp20/alpha crystallin family protein [Longibacter salinarum]PEN14391.1 heat-shock protein [Longibacter salinarum]
MTQMTRHSPTRTLRDLQREVDDIFGRFFSEGSGSGSNTTTWTPRTDMVESEEGYHLQLDVPGMSKDDLNINIQNNTLTISGERSMQRTSEGEERVRVERAFGTFHRTFALPRSVDAENIQAKYEDGVLTVNVPKAENAQRRRIEIE